MGASHAVESPSSRIENGKWWDAFSSLRHPNYRLWFAGQLVSLFGTWMQSTAQGYLIFDLTHSEAYLGYIAFASGLPTWMFMLYGGVIADRLPRRSLLIITQSAMMVLALILGALTFTGGVQPWHLIVLAFLLGVANAFDAPARQSFVLEMVDRRDLTNAIALNSTMFNIATMVGPAAAGYTYGYLGPAWCFVFNGLSFLAVIAALLAMRLTKASSSARHSSSLGDLKEGVIYVIHHPNIRVLVAMVGTISLLGMSFASLIPAWAVRILHGDAATTGSLQSARGLGAMLGALSIALLGSGFRSRGKLMTGGLFIFPLMLLILSQTRELTTSMVALVGVGLGMILVLNLANALVQTQVSDELRGRVMSVYTFVFFGLTPIGGLLMGLLAERIGVQTVIAINGGALLGLAGLIWLFLPNLRALE